MRLPCILALLLALCAGTASAEIVGTPVTERTRLTEPRTFELVVPAPPQAEGVDHEGWVLRVDFDAPEHKDRPH